MPHSTPPLRTYPSDAPTSANTPLSPAPEHATIAIPSGAPPPPTRAHDIIMPSPMYTAHRAAI